MAEKPGGRRITEARRRGRAGLRLAPRAFAAEWSGVIPGIGNDNRCSGQAGACAQREQCAAGKCRRPKTIVAAEAARAADGMIVDLGPLLRD